MREGEGDHLVTAELGTAEELQFAALLQVVHHHQRPLPVLGEGQQVPAGAESQGRDLTSLAGEGDNLLFVVLNIDQANTAPGRVEQGVGTGEVDPAIIDCRPDSEEK